MAVFASETMGLGFRLADRGRYPADIIRDEVEEPIPVLDEREIEVSRILGMLDLWGSMQRLEILKKKRRNNKIEVP